MTGLTVLCLPILLSAVFVFLASSVIHMASPWHKSDYPQMPKEEAVMDALRPLAPGSPNLRVLQLVGCTAFIGYAAALWPLSIWYRRAWSTTINATVDGLIYSLITGATFVWLWPQ